MMRLPAVLVIVAAGLSISASEALAQRGRPGDRDRIPPTHADVKYGPHARNVFDLWLPDAGVDQAAGKRPVFVFFHGGGFIGGDKGGFNPAPYLTAGMAVVSGNYRFVDGMESLSPVPLLDAARVIQTLRARAAEWNLDADRIAMSGSSAGAVISMWIGYHDDLADPNSDDPVARQSTRVKCIVPLDGPTNLDPRWINANMGGPPEVHRSFPLLFGATISESGRPDVQARIREMSPIEHVSAGDAPTLLIYAGELEGIPLPESASQGVLIHHAYFGKVMKDRLDEAGVPNELHTGAGRADVQAIVLTWLEQNLLN